MSLRKLALFTSHIGVHGVVDGIAEQDYHGWWWCSGSKQQ